MAGQDEIIFSGAYKDFKLGVKYDMTGKTPEQAAFVLAQISAKIEPFAYRFAGLGIDAISRFANPKGSGLQAVCGFFESTPPGTIKETLSKSIPKPELMSAAESYLLNQLLTKAGVMFKAQVHESAIEAEDEEPGDTIAFIGKYKEWVAIKKLCLENAQEYEVSGILSGINHSIVNKAYEFSGSKKDEVGAEAISKGRRRSLGNIPLALKDLSEKSGAGAPEPYLVMKALDNLGYKPYASPDMLTAAYPDIKPPKVRGRKPKG